MSEKELEEFRKHLRKQLDAKEEKGRLLYCAVRHNNLDEVKELINHDIGIEDSLVRIAIFNHNIEMVDLFFKYGGDINYQSSDGKTPLIIASERNLGNVDMVGFLLERKAKVNVQCKLGYTALMHAVEAGNLNISKLLIDAGTDLSIESKLDTGFYNCANSDYNVLKMDFVPDGTTARMIALNKGHTEIHKLLVEKEESRGKR